MFETRFSIQSGFALVYKRRVDGGRRIQQDGRGEEGVTEIREGYQQDIDHGGREPWHLC